ADPLLDALRGHADVELVGVAELEHVDPEDLATVRTCGTGEGHRSGLVLGEEERGEEAVRGGVPVLDLEDDLLALPESRGGETQALLRPEGDGRDPAWVVEEHRAADLQVVHEEERVDERRTFEEGEEEWPVRSGHDLERRDHLWLEVSRAACPLSVCDPDRCERDLPPEGARLELESIHDFPSTLILPLLAKMVARWSAAFVFHCTSSVWLPGATLWMTEASRRAPANGSMFVGPNAGSNSMYPASMSGSSSQRKRTAAPRKFAEGVVYSHCTVALNVATACMISPTDTLKTSSVSHPGSGVTVSAVSATRTNWKGVIMSDPLEAEGGEDRRRQRAGVVVALVEPVAESLDDRVEFSLGEVSLGGHAGTARRRSVLTAERVGIVAVSQFLLPVSVEHLLGRHHAEGHRLHQFGYFRLVRARLAVVILWYQLPPQTAPGVDRRRRWA